MRKILGNEKWEKKFFWHSPKRNHGAVKPNFAKIAAGVQSRNLPKPRSRGESEKTIWTCSKLNSPCTVYVRKCKMRHSPDKPWRIKWKTRVNLPRAQLMKRHFCRPVRSDKNDSKLTTSGRPFQMLVTLLAISIHKLRPTSYKITLTDDLVC